MPALADPAASAFLAERPAQLADPTALHEPDPFAPPTPEQARHHRAALELAAAFLVVAGLAARHLANSPPQAEPAAAARAAWARQGPVWLSLAAAALTHAAEGAGAMGEEELSAFAADYAATLGDHLNNSSADALAEGMATQMAGHWDEQLAWQRAVAGYGLERKAMRSHIASLLRATEVGRGEPVPPSTRARVEALLLRRAELIGENETHGIVQAGAVIAWLYRQRSGELGPDAAKRWCTTQTERVCITCAPMDGQSVGLDEQFRTPAGVGLWAPGAHPGCLCRAELVLPEAAAEPPAGDVLAKDLGADHYDRTPAGRFAPTESRRRPTAYAEPDDPEAAAPPARLNAPERSAGPFAAAAVGEPARTTAAAGPFAGAATGTAGPFAAVAATGTGPFAGAAGQQAGAFAPARPGAFAPPAPRPAITVTHHVLSAPAPAPTPSPVVTAVPQPGWAPAPRPPAPAAAEYFAAFPRSAHTEYTYQWEVGEDLDFDAAQGQARLTAARGPDGADPLRARAVASAADILDGEPGFAAAAGWQALAPQLSAVRGQALAQAGSLVPDLETAHVREIYRWAGAQLPYPPAAARAGIVRAAAGGGAHQAGLGAAYADWVVTRRADLVGAEGADLRLRLNTIPGRPTAPKQSLLLDELHGSAAFLGRPEKDAVRGHYRVREVHYRSALAGGAAAPGVIGWRLAYLDPAAAGPQRPEEPDERE